MNPVTDEAQPTVPQKSEQSRSGDGSERQPQSRVHQANLCLWGRSNIKPGTQVSKARWGSARYLGWPDLALWISSPEWKVGLADPQRCQWTNIPVNLWIWVPVSGMVEMEMKLKNCSGQKPVLITVTLHCTWWLLGLVVFDCCIAK